MRDKIGKGIALNKYVCSLDVGTTTIRAFIYDESGQLRGKDIDRVVLLTPHPGWVEIDPERLWETVVKVIKNAIEDAGLQPSDITCIGISTQRGTFLNWSKSTGKPLHNFITWKDIRSDELCKEWDTSVTMRAIRLVSKVLHTLTRNKKYMVGKILRLHNKMVNVRLVWALSNIPALKTALSRDDVLFGTVDTWLLYKFSAGALHLTDISNAAATGLYDPFSLDYALWAFTMLGIPRSIMPEVVDCAGPQFQSTHAEIFGVEIPIAACMADQSASVYGLGCFNTGDIKMTLGSGSFLDVNTGEDIHASMKGLVPLIAWRIGDELIYMAEGADHDTSSLIQWAHQMKCFENPSESSDLATSIPDTNGLFFIPAFCGLQAPVNDPTAAAGLIGLTPQTGSTEILRSVLESIAFSMKQLVETMENESEYASSSTIQIDGGVSRNNFIVQLIANLTSKTIERRTSSEMSAFGIAFLAGIQSGVWRSRDCLSKMKRIDQTFHPQNEERDKCLERYRQWVKACHRFKNWNVHEEM